MEKKINKHFYGKIKGLKTKLNKSIEKNGLNSNKTITISEEIDKLVKEYYDSIKELRYPKKSKMKDFYKKAYEALLEFTEKNNKFPSTSEWNKYAKNNNYLSNVSIEYMSKSNWKYLKVRVLRELNMKK